MGDSENGAANEKFKRSGASTVDWHPSFMTNVVWQILGLVLTVAGFLFGTVYLVITGADTLEFVTIDLLMVIVSALTVLIVHEGFHGLAALWFGGRPEFGATMLQRVFPVFYCTVPGHLFTRWQFALFALAPAVGISILGVGLMAVASWGFWLVVALAVNFGGAVGDFWMTGLVLLQPRGTLIEDQREGIRLHYVASAS